MERLLLLPLALLFLHPGLQAQPTPAEMAALEDLADAFPTLNWTGPDHCHWEGVQCDINGNVIAIVIDGHESVDGRLPVSFGELSKLRRVSVQNSNLNGLYGSFGALDSLEVANFDGNNFYYMPDSIAGCPKLKELTFSHNRFTTLPSWLGQMFWDGEMSLELLDVSSNRIDFIPYSAQYFFYGDFYVYGMTLYIYDNFLSFQDFEDVFYFELAFGSNVFLLPQNNFEDTLTIYRDVGEEVLLWSYLEGFNSDFQWYHNGVPLPSAPTTDDEPLVVEVSEETAGVYTCAATHYLFPGWTLWRNPIYLNLNEPAGVGDHARESRVRVYPNPARSHVFVERGAAAATEAALSLYDTRGRAVRRVKLGRKAELDLDGLPAGLYIAEIVSEKERVVEKILKK